MAKEKKELKGEKIKRALPFRLTDEEKARRGELAAELNKQLETATLNKKTEMSKHTGKISELTGRISKLLTTINIGEERREVQCTEVKNFEADLVEYHFKGDILETRPMTEIDRQLDLKNTKTTKKTPVAAVPKWQRLAPKYPRKKEIDDKDEEIAQVHRLETSRQTASSSVDPK